MNNSENDDYIDELNSNPNYYLGNKFLYGNAINNLDEEFNFECNYYNEKQITNILSNYKDDYLSLFSLNCQTLNTSRNELGNFIDNINSGKSSIHIIGLQETWCGQEGLIFNGYNLYCRKRSQGRGGGVGLLIKDTFTVEIIAEQYAIDSKHEVITAKISHNNFSCIVASLYRAPIQAATNITEFVNLFSAYLNYLSGFDLPVMICGDFNINQFKLIEINSSASTLSEHLAFNGYIQTIFRATRIKDDNLPTNTFSLIDLCCIKDYVHNLTHSGVIPCDFSDHDFTFNIFSLKNITHRPPQYFNKRSMTQSNLKKFKRALDRHNWAELYACTNTDEAFSIFLRTFLFLYNKYIPEKRIKFNRRTMPINPYMTKNLLKCRLKKIFLYKLSKSRPTTYNINFFKRYKNIYNHCCRKARKLYFRRRIANAGSNSKKLWSILKDSIGLSKNLNKVEFLQVNGSRVEGDKNIANCFSDHFGNLGPKLTPLIPKSNKNFRDFLPPPCRDTMFLEPLSARIVAYYIGEIKPKTSKDDHNLSMHLISKVADSIAKPLSYIFNLSFEHGVVPCDMKISRAIPIHKGGNISLLDHFRGVVLICSFSKILEKIMYERLLSFLESHNFFYNRQYGFRKKHSTVHNALDLTNIIAEALASNRVVMAILLDVRKCFDLVDQEILLAKLEHYGVRGVALQWFRSYFFGRKQRVFFNNINSDTLVDILIGVLQGSILGVLLFLVYINDLGLCCATLISLIFADDNCATLVADNLTELIDIANTEIPILISWYTANRLLIHPQKTKTVIFTTPRHNFSLEEIRLRLNFPVYINMNDIGENDADKISNLVLIPNEQDQFAKHLGFLLDDHLSFKHHFSNLHARLGRAVYSLRQMRNILDRRHLKLLYSAYVKSILDYGALLFTGVNSTTLGPIIKSQNKLVRLITNSPYNAPAAPLFKELKLLPIDKIIDFQACRFMFDYKRGVRPSSFANCWTLRQEHHGRELRNTNDFNVNLVNTNFLQNLPLNSLPRRWNRLPYELKSMDNRKAFCKALFSYQLDSIAN